MKRDVGEDEYAKAYKLHHVMYVFYMHTYEEPVEEEVRRFYLFRYPFVVGMLKLYGK